MLITEMIDDLKEIKKLKKEKYELKKKQDELTGNNQRTKETIKESKKHKKNVEKGNEKCDI